MRKIILVPVLKRRGDYLQKKYTEEALISEINAAINAAKKCAMKTKVQ